ncbi:MAG: hypothetical protein RRY53_06890, partial [Pseudoflavonifractor sp.]
AVLRRRQAQRSRRRSAAAADRNRAVIDLYLYAQKLLRWTGAGVDGEMLALAQRAKFSQHRLTEDQRMQMVTYAKNLRQSTKNRLTWYKKLAFEYVFGL